MIGETVNTIEWCLYFIHFFAMDDIDLTVIKLRLN